jgi:molybdate transport system substrate-binding protein
LAPEIERSAGVRVRASYAASSALARQIDSGAPADIFVSADLEWMDFLETRRRLAPGTRVNLLSNRLVLIGQAGRDIGLKVGPAFPLADALGRDRLAVADPAAVPAGKYARAALLSLGVWEAVAERLARAENVRGALLLVSRGETPLGIVYRSDALADRGVKIVDVFPESTHPRIVYPAALTATASADAGRVLAFLRAEPARRVFARQGFIVDVR